MTLFENAERFSKEKPGSTAFSARIGKTIVKKTHQEVFAQLCAVRAWSVRQTESRIGLLSANSIQWITTAWGVFASGKALAFLDPVLPIADLISVIDRTDLELILLDETLAEVGQAIHSALPQVRLAAIADIPFDSEAEKDTSSWHEGEMIFFTSGTSKNAKPVVTPTYAIAGHAYQQRKLIWHNPDGIAMLPLPLHHSFGFAIMNFFYGAGCEVFISSMKTIQRDIREVQPEMIALVPSAVEFLLKKKLVGAPLKSMVVAGAFCPESLAQQVRSCGVMIQNHYGSSELPCGIGDNLPENRVDEITLLPSAKVTIAPDGEVLVSDPCRFREYYKNPEDTAEVLIDGVVHTGDMGFLDELGRLHLQGRKKNFIVMQNGEKIFCPDLDADLRSLDGVADGAVIYIRNQLIACIAPLDGASAEQIQSAVDAYNAPKPMVHRISKVWIYGRELPYTSSGKLQRRKLEQEYEQ